MKKFENILLCSDIDGTLTYEVGKISKENLDAIEYFTENGGRFIISSGRYYDYAEKTLGYKPKGAIIALNGAHIYDTKTGNTVWAKSLDDDAKKVSLALLENVKGKDVAVYVNFLNSTLLCKTVEELEVALYGENEPFKSVFVAEESVASEINDYAKEHFAEKARVVKSTAILTEVLSCGTGKDVCIKKLCEYFGGKFTVVAVGDYSNDIEMIKAADIGYAVDNAIPEVKAVADRIAPDHKDHAIAYIVKELEKL